MQQIRKFVQGRPCYTAGSMLPSFERELGLMHGIAKAQRKIHGPGDRERVEDAKRIAFSAASEFFETDKGTHEAIYELQRKKLGTMQRLKKELAAIQEGKRIEAPKDLRQVTVRDGQLVWTREEAATDAHGRRSMRLVTTPVTFNDLLVDLDWGVGYALDPQVPKHLRKQYSVARARHEVERLTDQQLYLKALGDQRMDTLVQDAYRESLAEQGKERQRDGILTEKMIASQFRKWCLDHPDLPIMFERTDIHQDIEQKVDLCLRVNDWRRGVHVRHDPQTHGHFGVQITLNTNPDVQVRKHRQIDAAKRRFRDEYDDIVLMTVESGPAEGVRAWEKAGKPPGGPLRFWNNVQQKEAVFRGALHRLLGQEEIAAAWKEVGETPAA